MSNVKSKAAYTPVTEEELALITRETAERDRIEPRILSAAYDSATSRLLLEMKNGATVSVRARDLRGLEDATNEQLGDVRIVSGGAALHWDSIDVQMTTTALLGLIFKLRTAADVARSGGAARTPAKSAASRANGAKGGRPRKVAEKQAA